MATSNSLPLVGILPSAAREPSPRHSSGSKGRILSVKQQPPRLHYMPSSESIPLYKAGDDSNTAEALAILISSRQQQMKKKAHSSRQPIPQVSSSLKDILDTSCTDCNDFLASFTQEVHQDYKQLIPHLGTRKSKSAVIQTTVLQEKEDWATSFQIGPGYMLHHSKSKIRMNIDSAQFFGPRTPILSPGTPKKSHEEELQSELIQQLQQQILDLQLLLQEEKMNHGDTKRILTEEMHRYIASLQLQHDEFIKNMTLQHKRELENLQEQHALAIQKEKEEYNSLKERLTADINYVTASFEAYKVSSSEEIARQLSQQEAALKSQFDKEKMDALQALRKKMKDELRGELEMLSLKHRKELDEVEKEHKHKIEELTKQFSDFKALSDSYQSTRQLLEDSRYQCESLKKDVQSLENELAQYKGQIAALSNSLEEAHREYKELNKRLDERVRVVEEKYKQQIETLRLQSIDLRRSYMKKCDELVDEKVRGEAALRGKLDTARDIMKTVIETRHRAALSIAALDEEEEKLQKMPFNRPTSAPSTSVEQKVAIQKAGQILSE